jgi:Ca2+-binding EF-hand superfamily protein
MQVLGDFYRTLDQDNSNDLSLKELREGFSNEYGLDYTNDEWLMLKRVIDSDQSDKMTWEEFEEMIYEEGKVPGKGLNAPSLQDPMPKPESTLKGRVRGR